MCVYLIETHLNDEDEVIDFLLVRKPGRELRASTTGLCT